MNHIPFAKKTTTKPKGIFSCKNARLKLELLIFAMTITTREIRDVFKTGTFTYFYKNIPWLMFGKVLIHLWKIKKLQKASKTADMQMV